ncbi:hypothetical protein SPD48_07910 [Pseudogracilibacillus sp. SE30717A]|uniref:hypothetical protein n=1 Tax=Pseudogracilibacillus sp. SE30717A TaxID=3098293 RepID=UPI00300DF498
MNPLALLYLACILAGYALANLPTSALITAEIASVFTIIGSLVMVVFAVALIFLGVKALLGK